MLAMPPDNNINHTRFTASVYCDPHHLSLITENIQSFTDS